MDAEDIQYNYSLYIASLLYKELEKELLTEKERQHLDAWLKESPLHASLYPALQDRSRLADEVRGLTRSDTPAAIKEVFSRLGLRSAAQVRRMRMIRTWTAAAAVLLFLSGGIWLLTPNQTKPILAGQARIVPGGNKAVLTLGDGRTIVLDSIHNGQVAQQRSAIISRQNGQLVYDVRPDARPAGVEFNMVTTPRGGQYTVVLVDGSKVLLNAASSLRYPTAFTGNDRTVELSGEAYFEVVHNKSQPFIVKTHRQDIKVLGTSFDVMAYSDEPNERTTLVDGSVQVSLGAETRILTPGQQTLVNDNIAVANADVDKETAWTTGFFKFDHTDIHTIMREIVRWYDIDIAYETPMNDSDTYSGRIRRNLPLSDLITFLKDNGIHHFRLEGRKLTVLP